MVSILIFLFKINQWEDHTYIKLSEELRNSRKALINIQNKGNKMFWLVSHETLKCNKKGALQIKKSNKEIVEGFDYEAIKKVSTKLK